ncbi:MAG: GTPase, partial [Candidatus Izemoplasmatales bacterium]
MIFEPIVSISTKLGESAVNIVRISGEGSFDIVSKVWKGPRIQDAFTHTVLYGHIVDHEETIDEVMVSIFRSPRSFTTEDTVEIQCHGGSFIAMEIVKLLLREGARMAERGEFSRRAFLHGRIDLTQAESIMDMIAAKTKDQLRLANASLRGGIKVLVRGMQDDLLSIIATIEVNIDYPEYDDVEMLTTEILLPRMQLLEERMHQIVHASKAGARIKNGLSTAIVGRPNVGKSSLLNSLLKEERAIVTEVSGT